MMVKKSFDVRFATPAFLGNAEQAGQWRAPPFKALLRQWWRIAMAPQYNYDYSILRESEGKLFGNAWLKKADGGIDASRSMVRIRLDDWKPGSLSKWLVKDPRLSEIKNPVGAHLYLGYGPLNNEKGKGTILKMNASIQEGDYARLTLIFPEEKRNEMESTLRLIQRFGTLGGRSRNGWGSVEFSNADFIPDDGKLTEAISRPFDQCLMLNWPHALGKDSKGYLLWETNSCEDWSEAMRALALIKVHFRNALSFGSGFSLRHLLAYPVTKHNIRKWDEPPPVRLPNQLRFKVVRRDRKVVGMVSHFPTNLPEPLMNRLSSSDQILVREKQQEAWEIVHSILDDQRNRMHRITGREK